MESWWQALPVSLHIYYTIALVGAVLLIAQVILMLIGAEHADADGGSADSHSVGLEYLTVRSLMAFCSGLGWIGVILTRAGVNTMLTVVIATVIGGLLAWSVVWMIRSLTALASDGTLDYQNALQQIGTVVVSIQPKGLTGGQVEILIQGRLAVISAVGDPVSQAIVPGTKVRVIGLADRTTLRVAPA